MERVCPKRKKTKKLISDNDVKKLLNNNESDGYEKIIPQSRVPDDWPTGLYLSLYPEGFTLGLAEEAPTSETISYGESDFLRDLEQGLIPDAIVPMLGEMELIAEGKLVATILDYRGLPRPGSTTPYRLDFPIQKRHILSRSKESMVLELFEVLGERATLEQLHELENCLLMLQSPALCLDTSEQVFEVRSNIHLNQHLLSSPLVRPLITRITRIERQPTEILLEVQEVMNRMKRENSVREDATSIKQRQFPTDNKAPSVLSTVMELAEKRMKNLASNNNKQIGTEQPPAAPPQQPQPEGYVGIGHLKQFKQQPISPSLATSHQSSPMTSVGQSPPTATKISPKPIAAATVRPQQPSPAGEPMVMAKQLRARYAPGYIVPPTGQPMPKATPIATPVQRMPPVQMMPTMASTQPAVMQTGPMMPGPRAVMHMPPQGMVMPVGTAPIDSSIPKQMGSQGMMIGQPYAPRNYQYQTVQQPGTVPRGYVEHGQFMQRPHRQVLQIPLPANMNPHQQRQNLQPATQMQRMPYNQMGTMPPRMYPNQYQHQ